MRLPVPPLAPPKIPKNIFLFAPSLTTNRLTILGGADRIRTGVRDFADRCLASRPPRLFFFFFRAFVLLTHHRPVNLTYQIKNVNYNQKVFIYCKPPNLRGWFVTVMFFPILHSRLRIERLFLRDDFRVYPQKDVLTISL